MNAYAKIAIKIGVVIVVCIILMVAYNMLIGKALANQSRRLNNEIGEQQEIARQLDNLLVYSPLVPRIRHVQRQDMQMIRNLVPPASEFSLTAYLRIIHAMLQQNHLETSGISIQKPVSAVGKLDFDSAFASEISDMQGDLDKIMVSLQYFDDNMGEMNNMIKSYQFYNMISTDKQNYQAILGGIEQHSFSMRILGSYLDIKKFTFEIFNMRPHTALVNFQMAPGGAGFGSTRQYSASFAIITYGDVNVPSELLRVSSEYGLARSPSSTYMAENQSGDASIETSEGDESGEAAGNEDTGETDEGEGEEGSE
ncbi:MAG TPA: hypothetical protein VGB30_08190 [bacterium]|jgi:hypothetical protein